MIGIHIDQCTDRNREQHTIYEDNHSNASLEYYVLGDVIDECTKFAAIGSRRQMKRLSDFQTLFQIAPTSLINGKQCCSFVLRVIRNHDANKQC